MESRRASLPITLADGSTGKLDYVVHRLADSKGPHGPPWSGFGGVFIFFVARVAAWLIARSIVRPIDRLAKAARAFGAGQLDARADVARSDEIGDTARAFNDMAERIAQLLLTERELLANVSHELRTSLARIRVALDLASEGNPSDALTSLSEIAQDLAALEGIVAAVLASPRIALDTDAPTSSMPLRAERVETRALLEKSASRFHAAHPERELSVRLADDLPPIVAGAVARADGNDVVIEVRDRGIGIAAADVGRLFEPFFRADRSRTRATGGLGLGLALARRVVDAHKGTITFASELGTGTIARARLPGCEG